MMPVPLFLSGILSSTVLADAIDAFGFPLIFISIGYTTPFSSMTRSISFSLLEVLSFPL